MRRGLVSLTLALALGFAASALAGIPPRPGTLDRSFGQNGIAAVQTDRGCHSAIEYVSQRSRVALHGAQCRTRGSVASAVLALPDGGLLLAGQDGALLREGPDALLRLSPTGQRDPGFAGNGELEGMMEVHRLYPAAGAGAVALVEAVSGARGLERISSGGTIEPEGGAAVQWVASQALDVQIDHAGRILLLVRRSEDQLEVWRLLPSGKLDPSFGAGGGRFLGLYVSFGNDVLARMALGPDGDVYVLARGDRVFYEEDGSYLVHLMPTGQVDRRFGAGGLSPVGAQLEPTQGQEGPDALLALPHGGAVVAVGGGSLRVLRFTSSGQPDAAFGRRGELTVGLPVPARDRPVVSPRAIAYDGLGRVIVAGTLSIEPRGPASISGMTAALRSRPRGPYPLAQGDVLLVRLTGAGLDVVPR